MGRPTRRKPGPDDDDAPIIIVEGAPNPTIELQTSDLKELAQDGLVQPRTMHLDMKDLEEVSPGAVPIDRGTSDKVIVDLSEDPPRVARPRRVSAHRGAALPTVEPAPVDDDAALPVERTWIVVLVYVAAATALGISIYFRFFR